MTKNKREKYFRELAGLRVVAMYVQEYFRWGWQQLDQENDDGIDGYVIVRDNGGRDMGCNIRVQIKSGPGYLSCRPNGGKHVRINPYGSEDNLKRHMDDYAKAVQPVILVWVNTLKHRTDGTTYEDLLHPEVWWERLDNYPYTGGTVLTLTHKLGEHSKGDWFNTVKPMLKDWSNHPLIQLDAVDKKLYYSTSLKKDAKAFLKDWQTRVTKFNGWKNDELTVKKGRTGWRHINYAGRGQVRIQNSLQLLSVAEKIILSDAIQPVMLGEKDMLFGGKWLKIGLRARVQVDKTTQLNVQVVLLIDERRINKTKECDFFSVHVVKKASRTA
jgi:hypothetical protein